MTHKHCASSVGITSSDHIICLLPFAAALMLTGLIFVLSMTICLVPSPEQTKRGGDKLSEFLRIKTDLVQLQITPNFQNSVILSKKATCKFCSVS